MNEQPASGQGQPAEPLQQAAASGAPSLSARHSGQGAASSAPTPGVVATEPGAQHDQSVAGQGAASSAPTRSPGDEQGATSSAPAPSSTQHSALSTDYAAALRYLYSLPNWETAAPGQRPRQDVARPRRLFELLGVAEPRYPVAVIAGTNGKGSTAAMLESILRAAGHHVGLYTQPHLHTYRERIQIDRALIPPQVFAARLARVRAAVDALQADAPELGAVTTYEATTALALLHFAEEQVDIAVLEIGLGGRLDAVNAIAAPVAVITPIGLDHTETLGDTLAAIAAEKADVIKPGAIAITAPQAPEALAVITHTAAARAAPLRLVAPPSPGTQGASSAGGSHPRPLPPGLGGRTGRTPGLQGPSPVGDRAEPSPDSPQDWGAGGAEPGGLGMSPQILPSSSSPPRIGGLGGPPTLRLSLIGEHQRTNAAVAVAAAEALAERGLALPPAAIAAGLAGTQWPGRLELLTPGPPPVLVDGAHNPAGAAALAAALAADFPATRRLLVLGVAADKDLDGIVATLAPVVAQVYATAAQHPRSASRETVARAARAHGLPVKTIPTVAAAIRFAQLQRHPGDLVVVAGSLYVVAEARAALGHAPDADPPL
jgi:dihydrofolate synthase / folylpolyglutamate synthase